MSSFLKNLRGSVTRKNNSAENKSFQRNSVFISSTRTSEKIVKTSNKEETKGVIRSETFTIEDHESIFTKNKSFVRSSMFGRLSTFGRKKKTTKQKPEELKVQDDELSNSYKRYPTPSEAVASGSDPFNCLYRPEGNGAQTKNKDAKKSIDRNTVEYGTYRKSKLSPQMKEQLQEVRSESENSKQRYDDPDKFKTVTLSSFRKSFRQRFLTQKRDVPYNPSWFVEVEVPKDSETAERKSRLQDVLVFENEQYRPTARSPIRHDNKSPSRPESRSTPTIQRNETFRDNKSPIRSESRPTPTVRRSETFKDNKSPSRMESRPNPTVKRNETFRVERPDPEPSIRIEVKNSITPNEPGKIVPVGVAKPMPSANQDEYSKIIQRTWMEQGREPSTRQKMYQTCIQISDGTSSYSCAPRNDIATKPGASQSPQTRIKNPSKHNPSATFVSNYSPLKSVELLTNIRKRSEQNSNHSRDDQKIMQEHKNQGAAQSYGGKKWSQSPTFSSQQKVSSYVSEKLVRKDATNRNLNANTRRPFIKTPWR